MCIRDSHYYFNTRTGEVEQGKQSQAVDRIGPFKTRKEAEQALDIVRRRAEEWRREEEAEQ